MANLKVSVMKRHIEKGVAGDPGKCPIACRLKELGFKEVGVYPADISLEVGYLYQSAISPPSAAKRFMMEFDDGKPVKPFSFNLRGILPEMLEAAKANRRAQMKREKKRSK